MSEFAITITGFTEREIDHSTTKTFGGIVVRPPVQPGEGFKSAVLGRDGHLVDVHHVITTDEATVFRAESGRNEARARQEDIRTIASRIGQLANAPETVIQMMDSNPFPMPQLNLQEQSYFPPDPTSRFQR